MTETFDNNRFKSEVNNSEREASEVSPAIIKITDELWDCLLKTKLNKVSSGDTRPIISVTPDEVYEQYYFGFVNKSLTDGANDRSENSRQLDDFLPELESQQNLLLNVVKEYNNPEIVRSIIQKSWLQLDIFGGADVGKPIGRIYLNSQPEETVKLFTDISSLLIKKNIPSHIKEPFWHKSIDPSHANRIDKQVIYFNAADSEEVFKIVDKVYCEHPNAFNIEIPKFTAAVCDQLGKVLKGVAFGVDPRDGYSFGESRSASLAEAWNNTWPEAKAHQWDASKVKTMLATNISDSFIRALIDPVEPWFGVRDKAAFESVHHLVKAPE